MSSQLIFFKKNWADFEKTGMTLTATEGDDLISYIIDRSNRTAWGTSGSVDANNTQFVVNMGDVGTIDSLLFLKHNFKNFLIEYWDDSINVWVSLLNETNIAVASSYFTFTEIQTSQFRVTIYNTQVADSDKTLAQFIATSRIGQLAGWPVIAKPLVARNINQRKVLSGKSFMVQNVGFYSASLTVSNWNSDADLTIVEYLYNISEGFLFWPCGGDTSQFANIRQGYRMEDIFLCRCKNEYSPEYVMGLYKTGVKMQIDLTEVTT